MAMETMKLRILELEEQLPQITTLVSSTPSRSPDLIPSHRTDRTDQVSSKLGGKFEIVQESRLFGQTQAVVHSVVHKNRGFG